MLLTLYDQYGKVKTTLSPNDTSSQDKEIQGDNVLSLSFTLYEYVSIDVNDYVDFEGERYRALEKYLPNEKSTVEWEYNVKLYGTESLIKRFLVLNNADGGNEAVFTLTGKPIEHVRLIVQNINDGMDQTTNFKVGAVEGSENVVIDYTGKYCDEALKELADKVGTEWWIDGETVNLCRCERGEELTLAYGRGLTSLDRDTADNAKFYTRLFPIGSSRNIDAERYGSSRLQLPGGVKYVDVNVERYGVIHHYEQDAFADIYPRRTGVVSSVRSEEVKDDDGNPLTIYYFKDDSLTWNPNDYEIGGLVKHVSFQEGSELAGLGVDDDHYFEVNYNSDTKEFEIITIWPYDDDTQLPGGGLVPKAGDRYILWNIRMPDEYYGLAEKELESAVTEYNKKHALDLSRYKGCTDHVWVEESGADLYVGRRIRLESREYFPDTGWRASRITRISRQVTLPSQMDLEISDALSTGTLDKIDDAISDVKNYTCSVVGSMNVPDLIRSWDTTKPTDTNIYSARRSHKEFLSSREDDVAEGVVTFKKGLKAGEYGEYGIYEDGDARLGCVQCASMVSDEDAECGKLISYGDVDASGTVRSITGDVTSERGSLKAPKGNVEAVEAMIGEAVTGSGFTGEGFADSGFRIWKDKEGTTHLAVDRLTARQTMRIYELLIQKVRSVGGELVVSAANGKVKEVYFDEPYYYLIFETEHGFMEGDLIRCQTMTGNGLKYYWAVVAALREDAVLIDKDEFDVDGHPEPGDECVLMGNASDPNRQAFISIRATDDGKPRIDVFNGVHHTGTDGALRARMGCLDGTTDSRFPSDAQPEGYGIYSDNAYLRGTFVLRNIGTDVETLFAVTDAKIDSQVKEVKESIQGVETRMTEIEQTAEGISLKVERQQYRRNLLTGTSFALRDSGWNDHNAGNTQAIMATVADGQGRHAMHIADSVSGQYPGAEWNGVRLKAGTSYTMRMAWMVSTADWEAFTASGQTSGGFRVEIDLRGKDSTGAYTTVAIGSVWVSEATQKDTWKDIILSTGALPEGYTEYQVMAFLGEDHASGYISGVMLEEGDTYSGWGMSADDRERTGGNLLDGCFSLNKTGNLVTTRGLSVVQEDPDAPAIRTNSGMNTSNLTLLRWSADTLLTPGGDYIFSMWAKGSGDLRIYAFGGSCIAESADNGIVTWASSSAGDTFNVGSEWRRYWVKWHVRSTSNAPSFIYVVAQKGSDIQVTKPKLETGCEATPWTCDKQDSYKDEELYDRLLPTGIDLKNKVITLTADRTVVKTNSGETIAVFDSDGGVTAKKVRTEDYGQGHVEISGGTMEVFNGLGTRNMVIGEKDGYMVLSYYDNDGNFLYDLGPHGLTASGLAEASLAVTAYYKETAGADYNWMLLDTATGEWTQTIGNLYATGAYAVAADALSAKIEGEGRNTALSWGTAASLYRYTAAKVNGTVVSDPERNLTAELAEQANGKYFTSETICDGTRLVNLATGLYVKQGVKSQLLPTEWSSYHPQYGVSAMYVSGGVQDGNVSYMVGQTTTKGSGQIEV